MPAHAQNTDKFLDYGGPNQVSAEAVKSAVANAAISFVASNAAMLALADSPGQRAVRTDLSPREVYVQMASPATTQGNWERTTVNLASEVAFSPNGDIAAITVQLAIQEVRDDTDTKLALKAANAFTPTGDIAAVTVHAAIAEVASDATAKASAAQAAAEATAAAALSPVSARVNQSEAVAAVQSGNYQILVTDGYVPFNTDAARTPTLPQAAGFQLGADIVVADQTGAGASGFNITVGPFAGDTIIGTAVISTDRGTKRFKKVGATTWMVI